MRAAVFSALVATVAFFMSGCSHVDRRHYEQTGYDQVLSSPGAQFGQMPPAVQNTVRAQAGAAPIARIIPDRTTIPEHYVVTFENPLVYPPLYVSADGSVMNPDLTTAVGAVLDGDSGGTMVGGMDTTLRVADLPLAVQRVVRERTPEKPSRIETQSWGTRTVYILEFPEATRQPKIYVTSDGTVLKDSPE